ncbi:MAG TPA: ATP synthase subunit I [Terriglobales bacterium]|nr:ATP synthase subunit I [Terriglobales bacterium]
MSNLPNPSADSPEIEAFYAQAIPRMLRVMLVVGILSLFPVSWLYGWAGLIGVGAGGAVSYINFRALARGVEGLVDRVADRQSKEKGSIIVFRFLVRYGLVAVVAYAIFKGSALAFRGFLWGLCLPVASMMIEAAAEAWVAFRK